MAIRARLHCMSATGGLVANCIKGIFLRTNLSTPGGAFMSKLTTDDRQKIFKNALGAHSLGRAGGSATLDRLKQAFASLKSRLAAAGADEEDERTFLAAVERA